MKELLLNDRHPVSGLADDYKDDSVYEAAQRGWAADELAKVVPHPGQEALATTNWP